MFLLEILSIQPAPNKAVALTLWIRTGSKSRISIRQPPTIFRPPGTTAKKSWSPVWLSRQSLENGKAVENAPHHFGTTRHGMNLEGRHVVFDIAAAANPALEVACDARSFVEDRPQSVTAGQRIARLPIMFEQCQTSLLDHRACLRGLRTGMPGVRAQTTHRPKTPREPKTNPPTKSEPMSSCSW